ncbi:UNVERIFIED_CONTAM: F-box/kelch-repeat protein [Sesamum angustifolium]|uniref:F-box/kelch-repeat protein n=1 Tax=Sesamum angustifolium TaxID=2727405 RepID=A0AAW2Q8V3_9LAMI
MPGPFAVKRIKELDMCFSDSVQHDTPAAKSCSILFSKVADAKNGSILACKVADDWNSPILPGLPDDVSKHCLALVPRTNFPAMGAVSKRWRSFIKSKELITIRRLAGVLEEWLYVLTMDAEGKESHWEVLDCFGHKHHELLPMPGPLKAGFGVVVLNGKLLVIAGYSVIDGTGSVSSDVYQYDSCLNSWCKLASMNVARYDFACAEVNGKVYVVGGCGIDGGSLSCAEMYDPETDKWTLIESLRRPRWGCFACGFEGKLYVMGGRSSFTIGNSRFVDVYSPEDHAWCQMKNGCVMVTAHAVLGKNLCCMEWKNERKLAIFNPAENSWKMVPVPVTGSSSIGFRFGILDGKLLLFPVQEDPGYHTLSYNPDAAPGAEWQTSEIKPSGLCLCSVTIKA